MATVGTDNKVRFQLVQLGRDYGTTVEVVGGLNEKYPLLVAPPDNLQDGQLVRTLTASAGSNAKSD